MIYYRITDAVFQQLFLRNIIYIFTAPWQKAAGNLWNKIDWTVKRLDKGVHAPSHLSPFSSPSASFLVKLR